MAPSSQTLLVVLPDVAYSFYQYDQELERQLSKVADRTTPVPRLGSRPAQLLARLLRTGNGLIGTAQGTVQLSLYNGQLSASEQTRFELSFSHLGNYAGLVTDAKQIAELIRVLNVQF